MRMAMSDQRRRRRRRTIRGEHMSRILKTLVSFLAKALFRRVQSRVLRGRVPALVSVARQRRRRTWR
jgi:hypothetical protein